MPEPVKTGAGNAFGDLSRAAKRINTARAGVPSVKEPEKPEVKLEVKPEPVKDAILPEKPIASAATETVPSPEPIKEAPKPEVKADAVPQQTSADDRSAKRVFKITDPKALIEIPGLGTKSAEQLIFETRKSQDLQRNENRLNYLEEQLRQKETKPEPAVQPKSVELKPPVRPKDAIPGDEEHDEYMADLAAYKAAIAVAAANKPLMERLDRQEAREREVVEQRETGQRNVQINRELFALGMAEDLPFTFDALETADPASAQQVIDRIHATALDAGIDLKTRGHERALNRSEMRLLIRAAFPPGTLPPGYAYETQPVETEAMRQVREQQGKPLVEKEKPPPMPETGLGGIAPQKRAGKLASSGADIPWTQRLDNSARRIQG